MLDVCGRARYTTDCYHQQILLLILLQFRPTSMLERPNLDSIDWVAIGSVAVLLVLAYGVYRDPVFQFGVWATIITIWMTWFCYYGVKWVYDVYV